MRMLADCPDASTVPARAVGRGRCRRSCYDLSVWLSATDVLVAAGSKSLVVREEVLVAGVVQRICAPGP